MNDSFQKHSSSWVSFSYISFGSAAFMLALGLCQGLVIFWARARCGLFEVGEGNLQD